MAGRRDKARLVAVGVFGGDFGGDQRGFDLPALGDFRFEFAGTVSDAPLQHFSRFRQRVAVTHAVGDVVEAEGHARRHQRGRTDDEMAPAHLAQRFNPGARRRSPIKRRGLVDAERAGAMGDKAFVRFQGLRRHGIKPQQPHNTLVAHAQPPVAIKQAHPIRQRIECRLQREVVFGKFAGPLARVLGLDLGHIGIDANAPAFRRFELVHLHPAPIGQRLHMHPVGHGVLGQPVGQPAFGRDQRAHRAAAARGHFGHFAKAYV